MNVTKLECPNCHAALDNDYENAGTFFCKYCGQKMIVEEIQNAEYDLKARKMEMDHEVVLKKLEQAQRELEKQEEMEKERFKHKKNMGLIIFCMACLVLLFVLTMMPTSFGRDHDKKVRQLEKVEIEVQEAIQNKDYDLALIKVNQLRLDDGYSTAQTEAWDAKREDYINTINELRQEK